jgi:hypothetical protein
MPVTNVGAQKSQLFFCQISKTTGIWVDFYFNFRVGFAKFWGGIITGGKKSGLTF